MKEIVNLSVILLLITSQLLANAQNNYKWNESYSLSPKERTRYLPDHRLHDDFNHHHEATTLVEDFILNQTSERDKLKGKPYYVNTYPATMESKWGEKYLKIGKLQDSISYTPNGLRVYI